MADPFFSLVPSRAERGRVIADLTFFYRWGPAEAGSLSWPQLLWWHKQAVRINKIRNGDGE
uniref:Uncharacterized protein n=1 Tax=Serratia marcescens TaxID=615 RepID=A0A9X8YNL9_SERMA